MKTNRKRRLLLLLLLAVLLLTGCTSEQTLVKKVNEPGKLNAVEKLKPAALPWPGAQVVDLAPDNQTALLLGDQGVFALRGGEEKPLALPADILLPDASQRICWSPNARYACYRGEDACYVMDVEQAQVMKLDAVLSACFNADQTTLFFTRSLGEGSALYRWKVFSEETPEQVLEVPDQVSGAMFRTTKSQYLVLGENRLLCLEQDTARQTWKARIVADFTPSGMRADVLSYSVQTALCIVSGETAEGVRVFSVVSPDGEDFIIDQVSCFSPVREQTVENLPAERLTSLMNETAYPMRLKSAQLSPGGLYLMLWGEEEGGAAMYLLNLDKGDLTRVELAEGIAAGTMTLAGWCAGKTVLLGDGAGGTLLCSLTGWDD